MDEIRRFFGYKLDDYLKLYRRFPTTLRCSASTWDMLLNAGIPLSTFDEMESESHVEIILPDSLRTNAHGMYSGMIVYLSEHLETGTFILSCGLSILSLSPGIVHTFQKGDYNESFAETQ